MENHTDGYAFLQQEACPKNHSTLTDKALQELVNERHADYLAEEANPKAKPKHYATLNVGLFVNNGEYILTSREVFDALGKLAESPLQVLGVIRQQSTTEPTLIIRLDRPLTEAEAYRLSVELRQECIAQLYKGEGHLYGPKAKDWGPFNPDYFLYYKG